MKKLDTIQFEIFYKNSLKNLDKKYKTIFIKKLEFEREFNNIFEFSNSDEFKILDKTQQKFINVKLQIYEYLQKFCEENIDSDNIFDIRLDLHEGNFGFIKGTYEIRCFDPVYMEFFY